jgi:prepilin-type N-terminal cleavage/methylation domain-containing protein
MKKHLGFTLVELLAVFVILGIILFIAVPNIQKLINLSRVSAYNSQIELFKDAARKYVLQYANEIENSNDVTVSLYTLMDKKLIDRNVRNPITNQPFENLLINIKKIDGQFIYSIVEPPVYHPKLVAGLIPVYYDENEPVVDNRWKKADDLNDKNNWYNYDEWQWANAVTVTGANRTTYMEAIVGTTIPMGHINTMWVWIPRYKYRIPDGTGPREIDIVFEGRTSKSTGNAIDTYLTHPGFTFGDDELSGLWVAKFETSGLIASPTIKPGLRSVSGITKAMFDSVRNNIQSNTTTYGFTNDNDAHMMKNTEWAAVAYLYHSKYGKYGNPLYSGVNKEIWKNNSSSLLNGCTGSSVTDNSNAGCEFAYHTPNGQQASTTGNTYGIYGMSGGAYDFVMGNYNNMSDSSGFAASFFTNPDNSKYYDKYTTNDPNTACNGNPCLGHALAETSNWYSDAFQFVSTNGAWLNRGGYYNNSTACGAFNFNFSKGSSGGYGSYRVVLAPLGQ